MAVHLNDIGTIFELTIVDQDEAVVDISSATTKEIVFLKSDGTTLTKTASLVNTGTDGKMKYASIAGDLDVVGNWSAQGVVTIGTGTWHSEELQFIVHRNLV
jgi:hypothetical protein